MSKQEFKAGTKVFKFYFERESCQLKYHYLPVLHYEYLNGMQWNVIDLYTLVEKKYRRKLIFFKEECHIIRRYPAVLLDSDYLIAKAKFLYNYFMFFDKFMEKFELLPENDKEIYSIAANYYNDLINNHPDIMLKMENGNVPLNLCDFWK